MRKYLPYGIAMGLLLVAVAAWIVSFRSIAPSFAPTKEPAIKTYEIAQFGIAFSAPADLFDQGTYSYPIEGETHCSKANSPDNPEIPLFEGDGSGGSLSMAMLCVSYNKASLAGSLSDIQPLTMAGETGMLYRAAVTATGYTNVIARVPFGTSTLEMAFSSSGSDNPSHSLTDEQTFEAILKSVRFAVAH